MQNKKSMEVARMILEGNPVRVITAKLGVKMHMIPNHLTEIKYTETWEDIKKHYLESKHSKTLDQIEIIIDTYLEGGTLGQASKKGGMHQAYVKFWANVYEERLGSKYLEFIGTLEARKHNRHTNIRTKGVDFNEFPRRLTHSEFVDILCEKELGRPVYYYLHHAVDYGIEVIY